MKIGDIELSSPFIMAPMAGVTDAPFRQLCREAGAGLAVSEMVNAQEQLWETQKSQTRLVHFGESTPITVQILGNDPYEMANAARYNVDNGAEIIDINMGCPAKKVCKKAAGSALLQDEALVKSILCAVVEAVSVPVTLKIRTGWDAEHKNAITIAKIAEDAGIKALTIHGRTRADGFSGEAEHLTTKAVKQAVSIPIIANGDICSFQEAKHILEETQVDGIMIGRAALGNPWIFKSLVNETDYFPSEDEIQSVIYQHLEGLYRLYGEEKGVRIARKHLNWYAERFGQSQTWRKHIMGATTAHAQQSTLQQLFESSPLVA